VDSVVVMAEVITDVWQVRSAVEQLLARYAELIDDGDFAGVAGLIGDAAVTVEDGTVVARGVDAIQAMYEGFTRRYEDGTPRTQHVITNVIVEPLDPTGSGAPGRYRARSTFLVLQATEGLPLQPVITGRYRDVVEATAGGGVRFVERCMLPRLSGDLRHHLLHAIDPPA
jgi:hypothetical protein